MSSVYETPSGADKLIPRVIFNINHKTPWPFSVSDKYEFNINLLRLNISIVDLKWYRNNTK